ncbi:hypothetical protein [Legionella bononiensis]|uniref:RasGEF domain protein n=1 Tax=Legionella bononiensis TaxID=2793102 RepID=A0ABS1W6Z9_9GAMM|nr:hypothetical protein [Legionella bononiensis]MBL7481242.1 hypothetical protein [Legionella bononiensis]MBL7525148.1 hypothetical protein [Legionella bononiensis]MBL7562872.1 hypothetical protein [Legionella bononiensis]
MGTFFKTKKKSTVISKTNSVNQLPIESPYEHEIHIPLSSIEAHNILKQINAERDIPQYIYNFMHLVDLNNSQLIDLAQSSNQPLNNKQFLETLTATANRLLFALMNDSPYPTLYGDLMKLKAHFQVILLYYQKERQQGQPIASAYIQRFTDRIKSNPDEIDGDHGLLNIEESNRLTKYTINYSAQYIMKKDMPLLSAFILQPFLENHTSEKNFSYLRP